MTDVNVSQPRSGTRVLIVEDDTIIAMTAEDMLDEIGCTTAAVAATVVEALARTVSNAWVAFARTGNPNHAGMPQWAPYDEQSRLTMIFDTECRVVGDPTRTDRLNLKAVGL